ncbi:AAA domain-containing protein [Sinorhizobium meliloti]|nr:AAA domain-containing protein [Sinorhizobium meliloti]
MLTGVRGVGKTTTARILARALNYKTAEIDKHQRPSRPRANIAQAIMDGRHVDVIEMDAALDIPGSTTSVDHRAGTLIGGFRAYKVYIIDEVHMLSTQAFNGLLEDTSRSRRSM